MSITLIDTDPLTVFAPTDDAFARVPTDVLQGLIENKTALTGKDIYIYVHTYVLRCSAFNCIRLTYP